MVTGDQSDVSIRVFPFLMSDLENFEQMIQHRFVY